MEVAVEKYKEKSPDQPETEESEQEESVLGKLLKIDKTSAVVMVSDMLFAGIDTVFHFSFDFNVIKVTLSILASRRLLI